MDWTLSHRGDQKARLVADRHYNRQKVGSAQFVPPGRCMVLYAEKAETKALWVTSWPFAEYVKHAWAGAWMCSAFRLEGEDLGAASILIRDAVAATRFKYPEVPELGMVTFIDPTEVEPILRTGVPTWGYAWKKAGFRFIGWTKGRLMVWQLLPADMPEAAAPISAQASLLVA